MDETSETTPVVPESAPLKIYKRVRHQLDDENGHRLPAEGIYTERGVLIIAHGSVDSDHPDGKRKFKLVRNLSPREAERWVNALPYRLNPLMLGILGFQEKNPPPPPSGVLLPVDPARVAHPFRTHVTYFRPQDFHGGAK